MSRVQQVHHRHGTAAETVTKSAIDYWSGPVPPPSESVATHAGELLRKDARLIGELADTEVGFVMAAADAALALMNRWGAREGRPWRSVHEYSPGTAV